MTSQRSLACEKGFGTLAWPFYSPGLLLENGDMNSGVTYTRRLTQLLFSSPFGCGIICGLNVEPATDCVDRRLNVTIKKGLALHCFGNPIEVPRPIRLAYGNGSKPFPPSVWVVACYAEHECGPRELSACDDGSDHATTRKMAGFEIKLCGQKPQDAC